MGHSKAGYSSIFRGWKRVALFNVVSTWLLSICLLVLVIVASVRDPPDDGTASGRSLVFQGDCRKSSQINTGLHLLINVFSSLILGSSNYFMQILSAPSRETVDEAHKKGEHLEIGVPSMRNLTRSSFPGYNRLLWIILALSALPLHLFFNAAIYNVNVSTSYQLVVAADSFLDGGNFSAPGVGQDRYDYQQYEWNFMTDATWDDADAFLRSLSDQARSWQNLSIGDCMGIYDDPKIPLTDHRHLLIVVGNPDESYTEGWKTSDIRLDLPSHNLSDTENGLWLLREWWKTDEYIGWMEAETGIGSWSDSDWLTSWLGLDPITGTIRTNGSIIDSSKLPILDAKYCLVEPYQPHCQVRVFDSLLTVVMVFTLIKAVVCLASFMLLRSRHLLLTPGDAIESFIKRPDPATTQMCWLSAGDQEIQKPRDRNGWPKEPRQWTPKVGRLASVVPRRTWILSYIFFLALIILTSVLLGTGLKMQPISKSSFGENRQTLGHYVNVNGGNLGDLQSAFYANLPQLALSVSYFSLNAIITRMLAEREWSSFATKPRSLRLSSPVDGQKATYRLQLPHQWSIFLIVLGIFLHWLVSQCIFPKINIGYDAFPPYSVDETWSGRGLGYSSLTILVTLIACVLTCFIPILIGMRKLRPDIVTAASNSTVISAACHCVVSSRLIQQELKESHKPLASDPLMSDTGEQFNQIARGNLQWGVVIQASSRNNPGHLSLGSSEVIECRPVKDEWYM